ncbi:MAG: glycoside hydrolase family 3 C-terminal domain-containing protein [Fibrobacterales bacterium]
MVSAKQYLKVNVIICFGLILAQCVTPVKKSYLVENRRYKSPALQDPIEWSEADMHPSKMICEWGSEKINICGYETKEEVVNAFLKEMTLDEKIAQMTQIQWNDLSTQEVSEQAFGSIMHSLGKSIDYSARSWMKKMNSFQTAALESRLGLPLLIAVDANHGHGSFRGATIFPHNIGLAATRNFELIEKIGRITALELVGTGFNWTFAPCIAMPMHENWGRVYEGFSRDKELTIQAMNASIRGLQSPLRHNAFRVASTAKHYIGEGSTTGGKDAGDAIVGEAELRESLLPSFIEASKNGVSSIMVGLNSVNGERVHQSKHLVSDILKDSIGFKGVVLTDWHGGTRFGPPRTVVNAGIDMAMHPSTYNDFIIPLKNAVDSGAVPEERINSAVTRILTMKYEMGLFKNPFPFRGFSRFVGHKEHRAVARQAVRESMVLLKNKENTLPLKRDEKIIVIGEHAARSGYQSGGWTVLWQGTKTNYEGSTSIIKALKKVNPTVSLRENCSEIEGFDKIVVVTGEKPYSEFLGDAHRGDHVLALPSTIEKILGECKDKGQKIITVLITGRPININKELQLSDAFVVAWLPGSEGDGVADFLYAINNFIPTGKLPYDWPIDFEKLPIRNFPYNILFKFSYGLSYKKSR